MGESWVVVERSSGVRAKRDRVYSIGEGYEGGRGCVWAVMGAERRFLREEGGGE